MLRFVQYPVNIYWSILIKYAVIQGGGVTHGGGAYVYLLLISAMTRLELIYLLTNREKKDKERRRRGNRYGCVSNERKGANFYRQQKSMVLISYFSSM